MITKELIRKVLDSYPLSVNGIHGISHWARVRENGLRLAEVTGAHRSVVELFALFHDSQRLNEGRDFQHGLRGAQFAKTLKGRFFDLSEELFDLLYTACERHTADTTHNDITIQTCFDADRLDLGRIDIIPDPDLLCTDAAKQIEMLNWAFINSKNGNTPDFISTGKILGTNNRLASREKAPAIPWLHGTTQYFERWARPPFPSRYPKYLRAHSFVSLSSDIKYAYLHRGRQGGICATSLLPGANLLDLRVESEESLQLREKILSTELGKNYRMLQTSSGWFEACNSGSVLRYVFNSKDDHKELFEKQRIASSATADRMARFEANMYVHNFNRGWIELVIGTAHSMGFNAVICNELEPEVSNRASTQLFVFNTRFLAPPVWIEYPQTARPTIIPHPKG